MTAKTTNTRLRISLFILLCAVTAMNVAAISIANAWPWSSQLPVVYLTNE